MPGSFPATSAGLADPAVARSVPRGADCARAPHRRELLSESARHSRAGRAATRASWPCGRGHPRYGWHQSTARASSSLAGSAGRGIAAGHNASAPEPPIRSTARASGSAVCGWFGAGSGRSCTAVLLFRLLAHGLSPGLRRRQPASCLRPPLAGRSTGNFFYSPFRP